MHSTDKHSRESIAILIDKLKRIAERERMQHKTSGMPVPEGEHIAEQAADCIKFLMAKSGY